MTKQQVNTLKVGDTLISNDRRINGEYVVLGIDTQTEATFYKLRKPNRDEVYYGKKIIEKEFSIKE